MTPTVYTDNAIQPCEVFGKDSTDVFPEATGVSCNEGHLYIHGRSGVIGIFAPGAWQAYYCPPPDRPQRKPKS